MFTEGSTASKLEGRASEGRAELSDNGVRGDSSLEGGNIEGGNVEGGNVEGGNVVHPLDRFAHVSV